MTLDRDNGCDAGTRSTRSTIQSGSVGSRSNTKLTSVLADRSVTGPHDDAAKTYWGICDCSLEIGWRIRESGPLQGCLKRTLGKRRCRPTTLNLTNVVHFDAPCRLLHCMARRSGSSRWPRKGDGINGDAAKCKLTRRSHSVRDGLQINIARFRKLNQRIREERGKTRRIGTTTAKPRSVTGQRQP